MIDVDGSELDITRGIAGLDGDGATTADDGLRSTFFGGILY